MMLTLVLSNEKKPGSVLLGTSQLQTEKPAVNSEHDLPHHVVQLCVPVSKLLFKIFYLLLQDHYLPPTGLLSSPSSL